MKVVSPAHASAFTNHCVLYAWATASRVVTDERTLRTIARRLYRTRSRASLWDRALLFGRGSGSSWVDRKQWASEFRLRIVEQRRYPRKFVSDPYDNGPARFGQTGPTTAQFVREHPTGTYVLTVRGHALAVIDGTVYDFARRPRARVLSYVRLEPVA